MTSLTEYEPEPAPKVEPVLWAITLNGEFVLGNIFALEAHARQTAAILTTNYPFGHRKVVPLCVYPEAAPIKPKAAEPSTNTELLRDCHVVLHDLGQIHSADFTLAHELAAARKRITDRGGTLNCIAELMRRIGDAIKAESLPRADCVLSNDDPHEGELLT